MDRNRTARRSKALDVVPIDDTRFAFRLTLEDKAFSDAGEEMIHSLEIEGELSLPDLEILSIRPRAIHHPYPQCGASLAPFGELVGARIGGGFRGRVMEAMGKTRGCTHFMTLALDLGAAHTLSTFLRMRQAVARPARDTPKGEWIRHGLEIEPRLENACIALQTSSLVIQDARDLAAQDPKPRDGE